ncbi:MAG: tRNA (N6-isopentenyl adenosine(37)-C2)-methylthiotransferase MiaB [Bdellovibrionales bacterium]|nr:tRNA (N6-isopentenyl adenosine(37)-C2)-methylthiotransferase MiaB [Bdellovibrionales bacterium]
MGKKYFIKTFGCQMNAHDSERMAAMLAGAGYAEAPRVEAADLVLFNTCSVRDKSEQKAYSAMGVLKKGGSGKRVIIGFTGCVAQQDKEQVFEGAPHLDFVLGTDSIDQLPEVIYRVEQGERKVLQAGFDPSNDYSLETKTLPGKSQAFVNIMKGCDNFCTYCIVPFTRGREKSRRLGEIVQDVKRLLLGGVVEISLLGQNVNSYGKSLGGEKSGQTFPLLLRAIQAMADDLDARGVTDPTGRSGKPRGLRRLRYTTSHPKDFDEEMIACHRELSRLVPHVHLPVQAGAPRILRRMKRYVPIETYASRLERLREAVPDMTISTDLIVGFPGETEAEFEDTLSLMRRLRYDFVFAYSYSPRPGTAALRYGDTVPEEAKKSRLARLNALQAEIQREKHKSMEGKVFEVLVEGPSKTDDSRATGRTAGWRSVNFPLPSGVKAPGELEGRFMPVRITATNAFGIAGEPV